MHLYEPIEISLFSAGLGGGGHLPETAAFHSRGHTGRRRTGRRDEIERAAEDGGAEPVGRISAIHLGKLRLPGIGEAHGIGAVGAIDRQPVLQHQDPALNGILL